MRHYLRLQPLIWNELCCCSTNYQMVCSHSRTERMNVHPFRFRDKAGPDKLAIKFAINKSSDRFKGLMSFGVQDICKPSRMINLILTRASVDQIYFYVKSLFKDDFILVSSELTNTTFTFCIYLTNLIFNF